MNLMKVTKWSGTTLLWLGMLTGLLALASVWTAWLGLNRLSQLKPTQTAGEPRDQVLPGWEKAQTAPDTGKDSDENYWMGVRPTIDPSRTWTGVRLTIDPKRLTVGNTVPQDPSGAETMVPTGWAKTLDNTGRLLLDMDIMTPAVDPTDAGAMTQTGWAKMVDNTGRLLLDADVMTWTVDPSQVEAMVPDGWAKTLDNTGR